MSSTCATCGKPHDGLPLAYGAHAPFAAEAIPRDEREARLQLSSDQCIIDDERFFVLGRIPLPVLDAAAGTVFHWGVWLEMDDAGFDRVSELWEQPGRESEPTIDAVLATRLPGYPDTLGLKVRLQLEPVGTRPRITVIDEHPLAGEQETGITLHRVLAIHDLVMADN